MPHASTYPLALAFRRERRRPLLLPLAAVAIAGTVLVAFTQIRDRAQHGAPNPGTVSVERPAPAPAALEFPAAIAAEASAQPEEARVPVQPPVSQARPLPQPAVAETSSVRQPAAAVPAAAVQAPPAPGPASFRKGPAERWAVEGITLVIEGQEWDADSLTNVDAALSKLPGRVRAQLGNRELGGVSILVNRFGRTLSGKQPYGGAANFFSTNDARNELVLFPGQSAPTILHEMGHAYNLRRIPAGRYALVFLDPEMQSFMAATGWRVLSTPDQVRAARDHMGVAVAYDGAFAWPRVSNSDPLEDFANSFALYFFNPDDLKARSPERFAWFEANVGRQPSP